MSDDEPDARPADDAQPATDIKTVRDGASPAVPVENVPPANVTAAAPETGQPVGTTDVVSDKPVLQTFDPRDPLNPLPPGHPNAPVIGVPPADGATTVVNEQMPAHVPVPVLDTVLGGQPEDPGAVGAQMLRNPALDAAIDRIKLVIQEARNAVRGFPLADVGGDVGKFVTFMRETF